ncbi:hypothetical protein [Streptomyces gardneri]|uniref:hypothetical protein n=1 Tax=Streptomyces gardneri TaxID=66892 RepID=UPI003531031A
MARTVPPDFRSSLPIRTMPSSTRPSPRTRWAAVSAHCGSIGDAPQAPSYSPCFGADSGIDAMNG